MTESAMTDDELITRLRECAKGAESESREYSAYYFTAAADRIAQLAGAARERAVHTEPTEPPSNQRLWELAGYTFGHGDAQPSDQMRWGASSAGLRDVWLAGVVAGHPNNDERPK